MRTLTLLLLLSCFGFAEETDPIKLDPNMTLKKADAKGIAWLDPREKPFRIAGLKWIGKEKVYRRLPVKPQWTIRGPVNSLSNCTAGGQIQFKTDSPQIFVKVVLNGRSGMYHMPATGQSGVDMYIGAPGKKRYVKSARFSASSSSYQVQLLNTTTKSMREITLNLPLYNGVKSIHIGVKAGSTVTQPTPYSTKGNIVVYGTSITQGGCAARPGMAYSNILSRKINTEFVNLGFSGNGRGEPALANIINTIKDTKLIILDYEANAGAV